VAAATAAAAAAGGSTIGKICTNCSCCQIKEAWGLLLLLLLVGLLLFLLPLLLLPLRCSMTDMGRLRLCAIC
jgi:hypothetical protein